eukprot:2789504-Rhodomonas_salina.1
MAITFTTPLLTPPTSAQTDSSPHQRQHKPCAQTSRLVGLLQRLRASIGVSGMLKQESRLCRNGGFERGFD